MGSAGQGNLGLGNLSQADDKSLEIMPSSSCGVSTAFG